MKQKQLLIWGQALLWCLVIIFFGIMIVTAENTPLSKKIVEKKMTHHYQKLGIKEPLEEGSLVFDKKKNCYKKKYYQKQYPDHSFYIYYKEKQLTDTYQEAFLKGKDLIKARQEQLQKQWQTLLQEMPITTVEILVPFLDEVKAEEKEIILRNDNLYRSGLYTVHLSITSASLEDEIVETTLQSIEEVANTHHFLPKSYQISYQKGNRTKEITIEKENLS